MKILFTGGGSGGHFYPIIAVAEEIEKIVAERKLIPPVMYFMAPEPIDERMLFDHGIKFVKIPAGKLRTYVSSDNFFDIFRMILGTTSACFKMFSIYPDVVFGKGGYGSFPALFASWFFRIPMIIHESDSVPGRVNLLAGKHASRIAVSYSEAAKFFPNEKVAWTGQPVRREVTKKPPAEGLSMYKLENNLPVMLVLGGSLGAEKINELILNSLPDLLPKWQIIHQTGRANIIDMANRSKVIITDERLRSRYHPFDFLPSNALSAAAGVANLVISRAGSSIFEIASWKIPSIIIPISKSNGDHQRQNAYNYAKSGATVVIEENNLSTSIFKSEAERLIQPEIAEAMKKNAETFFRPDSARKIAEAIIEIALDHEE